MRPVLARLTAPASLLLLAVAVAVVWSLFARPPAPEVIPPTLETATKRHEIQNAIDSVAQRQLQADQDSVLARAARRQAIDSMRQVAARQLGRQADSLARVAEAAATAQDSAVAWQAAYEERTAERDRLLSMIASKDSTIADKDSAYLWAMTQIAIASARATRSDSLRLGWEQEARRRVPPCRIGPLPCPPRTITAVIGFAAGVWTGSR